MRVNRIYWLAELRIAIGCLLIFLPVMMPVHGQESPCPGPSSRKMEKDFEKVKEAYKRGDYKTAIPLLRAFTQEDPDFAEPWLLLGMFQVRRADPNLQVAAECFRQVISLCPELDVYPYYYLGDMAYGREDYAEAVTMLKHFLADVDKIKSDRDYDRALRMLRISEVCHELISNPVPFNPSPVPGISTNEDEYLPIITPDNEFAFFTRRITLPPNRDDLVPRSRQREMFFYSRNENGRFGKGEPMPSPFNKRENEGGATLTADNRELFYTLCETSSTGYYNCDICTSRRGTSSWSEISNAGKGINKVDTWESQPSVTSDGKQLFFISDRPGGLGGYDIYVSERNEKGEWGPARNLGEPINTPGNEKSPYIHTDSQTLYFSSDGHPGLGGYDIFYTRMKDGKWGKPVNIGYPINSKDDDVGFFVSMDGKLGFFASNKLQGFGGWDLYSFDLYPEARPQKIMLVKGSVQADGLDTITQARIELKNAVTRTITEIPINTETGEYVAVVPLRHDHILTVKKEGFAYTSRYIEVDEDTSAGTLVEIDLDVKPIELGASYDLNDIYFDTDSFNLSPSSVLVIDGFIEFLQENKGIHVSIEGHTDDVGDAGYNQRLSESRAHAVHAYLIRQGIAAARLRYVGHGESKPIASNATEEGRAQNRRTVFVITRR